MSANSPSDEMPTRQMNDPSPHANPSTEAVQPAAEGEMAMREMNDPASAPTPAPGDSPREQEKGAAYIRDRAEEETRPKGRTDKGKK